MNNNKKNNFGLQPNNEGTKVIRHDGIQPNKAEQEIPKPVRMKPSAQPSNIKK